MGLESSSSTESRVEKSSVSRQILFRHAALGPHGIYKIVTLLLLSFTFIVVVNILCD